MSSAVFKCVSEVTFPGKFVQIQIQILLFELESLQIKTSYE